MHWKTSNSIWISDFIFVPTLYIQLPQSRDKNEIEENQIEEIRKYWVLDQTIFLKNDFLGISQMPVRQKKSYPHLIQGRSSF